MPIHVTSEIGKLKQALLYRPGIETQNYPEGHFGQVFSLRPSSSLFDLDRALAECDAYTSVLEHEGVEVLYLDQLLIEALDSCPEARASFVDSFVDECGAIGAELQQAVREHLEHTRSAQELVSASIGGIRHGQVTYCFDGGDRLAELTGEAYAPDELLVSPLNTMWFVRDPVSTIGSGISFNHMYWPERNREVALYQTIFKYHPNFKDTPSFYRHDSTFHIEGGDIINLDAHNVAVGISQRTESAAIDMLARTLLWNPDSSIDAVWAIEVPERSLCIHLDTYLSRVDYDTFVVDPQLLAESRSYQITRNRAENLCQIHAVEKGVKEALAAALGIPELRFIPCGGSNPNLAEKECTNNAASVLCLRPGKVCVYEENQATNAALEQAGIDLVPISIHELTNGFGGPNCLCLPLRRDE